MSRVLGRCCSPQWGAVWVPCCWAANRPCTDLRQQLFVVARSLGPSARRPLLRVPLAGIKGLPVRLPSGGSGKKQCLLTCWAQGPFLRLWPQAVPTFWLGAGIGCGGACGCQRPGGEHPPCFLQAWVTSCRPGTRRRGQACGTGDASPLCLQSGPVCGLAGASPRPRRQHGP